jgi:hypothetical protein
MPLTTESAARKDRTQPSGNSMQHRHFAEIARIIRELDSVHTGTQGFVNVREDVAAHFANQLAHTNPRFDRERFLAACKA